MLTFLDGLGNRPLADGSESGYCPRRPGGHGADGPTSLGLARLDDGEVASPSSGRFPHIGRLFTVVQRAVSRTTLSVYSSLGRAPHSHCESCRFDFHAVHRDTPPEPGARSTSEGGISELSPPCSIRWLFAAGRTDPMLLRFVACSGQKDRTPTGPEAASRLNQLATPAARESSQSSCATGVQSCGFGTTAGRSCGRGRLTWRLA